MINPVAIQSAVASAAVILLHAAAPAARKNRASAKLAASKAVISLANFLKSPIVPGWKF